MIKGVIHAHLGLHNLGSYRTFRCPPIPKTSFMVGNFFAAFDSKAIVVLNSFLTAVTIAVVGLTFFYVPFTFLYF